MPFHNDVFIYFQLTHFEVEEKPVNSLYFRYNILKLFILDQ